MLFGVHRGALILVATLAAAMAMASDTQGQSAVAVNLWRLDCGSIQENDLNLYSDTYAYVGKSKLLTASCYLIKHGHTYMLWDAGLPADDLGLPLQGKGSNGETLSIRIVDQLARIGVETKSVSIIAISHYHFDHTGQAKDFPGARLLMGKRDVEALRGSDNPRAKPLANWLAGGGVIEEIVGDKDIFGDGTVVMLDLPGHTPGHHGLLVKLRRAGYILFSGDVAHFQENYDTNGIPSFNADRSQSLASLARFKEIAQHLHATVVIQHEPADIHKLPEFPDFAQ